ncbi:MAG: hypothetical protein ACRECT_00390 [Thermoplasmata archaeon]
MPLEAGVVLAGLTLLLLATVPLGLVILRVVERFLGYRLNLSPLERVLLAPYLSVTLFFVVASLPIPVYGALLLLGLIVLGVTGHLAFWWGEGAGKLVSAVKGILTIPVVTVLIGTLALVALEVYATGTHPFPNALDGSFQALNVKLTLEHKTLPWTLLPYSASGIIYPFGATVWLTLPVLLLGWPIQTAPVVLPPLFLGLSAVAAYCWANRLGGFGTSRGASYGILFAAFFGLVAAWPRLFIGGSYDFAICLPLFLMGLGWIRPFVESFAKSWRAVIVFGCYLGVCTSLSLAIGELLVLLLVAFVIVYHRPAALDPRAWAGRIVAIIGVGAVFVLRSIVGIAVWFPYPGHVLTAQGSPPLAHTPIVPVGPPASLNSFLVALNPFGPYKWLLSPIPVLNVELAILLFIGLVVVAVVAARPSSILTRFVPRTFWTPVLLGTAVAFLWTLFLLASSDLVSLGPALAPITSSGESTFLLFTFYEAIATIPLIATLEFLYRQGVGRGPRSRSQRPALPLGPGRRRGSASRGPRLAPWSIALGILLILPFAVGLGATATQVPTFLSSHLDEFSNVTSADVGALSWATTHLPKCSVAVVAPGSAGQFLPIYATLTLDYPMVPSTANLSYSVIVNNLTRGIYTTETRQAFVDLGATVLFITGQTSVSYLPFLPGPVLNSEDFTLLYHEGDAYLLAFAPGISQTGCAAT